DRLGVRFERAGVELAHVLLSNIRALGQQPLVVSIDFVKLTLLTRISVEAAEHASRRAAIFTKRQIAKLTKKTLERRGRSVRSCSIAAGDQREIYDSFGQPGDERLRSLKFLLHVIQRERDQRGGSSTFARQFQLRTFRR